MPHITVGTGRAVRLAQATPFSPSSLTWAALLNGDSLVAGDGVAISQWDDTSGNAKHATQATGAKQPTTKAGANALNGHNWASFDGGDCIVTPAIDLSAVNKAMLYAVVKDTTAPAAAIIGESSANYGSNNGGMLLDIESGIVTAGVRPSGSTANNTTHGVNIGTTLWRVISMRVDNSNRKNKALPFVNGDAGTATIPTNTGNTAGNLASLVWNIGSRNNGASLFLNGGIAYWALASGLHYPTTHRKMVKWLSDQYGLGVSLPVGILACDGDSNTDANDVTSTVRPWPNLLIDRLTDSASFLNSGIGGQGFGSTSIANSMAADAATLLDPYLIPETPGKNILVVMNGINDLYTPTSGATAWNSATKETTLQRIKDYCSARRALGWTVILPTLLPNNNPGWDATAQTDYMATERPYINSWITGSAVSTGYCDAIVDMTGHTGLEDYNNTTYYHTDKAHLIAAGHTAVADLVEPVVATMGMT